MELGSTKSNISLLLWTTQDHSVKISDFYHFFLQRFVKTAFSLVNHSFNWFHEIVFQRQYFLVFLHCEETPKSTNQTVTWSCWILITVGSPILNHCVKSEYLLNIISIFLEFLSHFSHLQQWLLFCWMN